ncbi:ubiquitin carboxyl-terminal hydrolase Usp2-like isoform X2 [Anopheles marshallii]|uniref:ubiquitin carboxyl-terminal hydrolase Usp2-like isoform X2 n=1 Tax=Anopheles marshallii TaxID=1521116 RepID=UPI00237C3195|nr:ubiquitin carboxyl-terminal hydrolase Usp2-like isoform X2 [Anopheles marshallii]
MPVISAYSSSGSRYIQPPSSSLTRSNYSDRIYYSPLLSSNKTYSISNSGLYRKSTYRFDSPFTSTTSSPLYHRREERDYSSKNRTISKNSEVTSDCLKATVDTDDPNTNGNIDSIKNNERRTTNSNRSSRYSSTVSSYAPTSLRNSGNYVSNLRNTALSGAEIYQRYSISTYKPSSSVASRITQSSLNYTGSLQENSNLNKDSSLVVSPEDRHHYNSKATIRLRPPASAQNLTNANSKNKSTNDSCKLEDSVVTSKPSASALVTAIVTTDDLGDEDVGETKVTANDGKELQVTATIRIKPKCGTSKIPDKEIRKESGNNIPENRSVMNDSNVIATSKANSRSSIRNVKRINDDEFEEENQSKTNSFHNYQTVDTNNDKIVNNSNDHGYEKKALAVNGVSHASNTYALSTTQNEYNDSEKECNIDQAMNLRHSVDLHNTVKSSRNYHDQSTTEKDTSTSSSRLSTSLKPSYERLSDANDSSRTTKAGLCGLWNIGNTCFMNSMIQCLSHTRELTSFLRSQPSTELGTNKDHRILAEYTKLIKNMWSGSQRSINPSDLKHAFSSKHRMYSGSAQQDAQEFLRFFLDSLHGALNVAVKRDPLGEIDDAMNSRVKADMLWEWYSKAENSVIKDLFVGQLRSTLKCTHCDTESTMFDPFWDLSLPLPTTNSRCKLENCLEMFIKEEILDGIDQPTCSNCETRRKCTKSLTIERFPRYLVIHLKRFSETRFSKLTNTVEFPTKKRELNLQPYASEDISGPVYYSLYGISNHIGSTAGGHYVAVCKHPTIQEWNEFNDNYVSETSEGNLVTSNAYVLFYERA